MVYRSYSRAVFKPEAASSPTEFGVVWVLFRPAIEWQAEMNKGAVERSPEILVR